MRSCTTRRLTVSDSTNTIDVFRHDFLDFPTAWAIQEQYGDSLNHHPQCSSVQSPAFLCDCGAIQQKWKELRSTPSHPDES